MISGELIRGPFSPGGWSHPSHLSADPFRYVELCPPMTPLEGGRLVRPGAIVVDEVADPSPGPDDVLVAVGGVGLCGSDVSVFRGDWPTPSLPWILGHEAFGRIEAVGERVPLERVGERVVIEPNVPCLRCDQCLRGRPSSCVQRASIGMNRPGALAEKLVVPSPFAWKIAVERRRTSSASSR